MKFPGPESGGTILIDGTCLLCNYSAGFVMDRDPDLKFRFSSLQSEKGKRILISAGIQEDYSDSIVFISGLRVFKKSRAILEILRRMNGAWKIFYLFRIIPSPFLDLIYDRFARSRSNFFTRNTSCRFSPDFEHRFL